MKTTYSLTIQNSGVIPGMQYDMKAEVITGPPVTVSIDLYAKAPTVKKAPVIEFSSTVVDGQVVSTYLHNGGTPEDMEIVLRLLSNQACIRGDIPDELKTAIELSSLRTYNSNKNGGLENKFAR
jgi:hypothetical protein